MGGKSSAPEAPSPQSQATAQLGTNVGTALANTYLGQTNQVTPFGSLSSTQTGSQSFRDPFTGQSLDIPQFTQTQTLSAPQQAILDEQQRGGLASATAAANMAGNVANRGAFSFGQNNVRMPSAPNIDAGQITKTYSTDFSQDRQRVEDALMARMNPNLERDRVSMEGRLANQGVRIGSDAYTRAQGDFGQQANDARYGAILNAGQEQSRLTGLEAQRAQFQNAAQDQSFQQGLSRAGLDQQRFSNEMSLQGFNDQRALTERNQPLNELAAMQSGGQITQPNFMQNNAAQMPTTDIAGLMQSNYQNQMSAYNQRQQQQQSLFGGILGAGASILSDERAKGKMKPVGKLQGHNLYEYNYKGEGRGAPKHIGVSAQEAERKNPSAVVTGRDGLKRVNYGALFNAGASR